jgi:cytoskeleton protein RodZ
LSISYSNDSWTDVRDANGKKLLYRTVKKGENIALAGKLPLSVFFGFAQGVKVTFNGEEIDVPGYTRGVFARFTVGESVNP